MRGPGERAMAVFLVVVPALGAGAAVPPVDPVLQPGIVEEIRPAPAVGSLEQPGVVRELSPGGGGGSDPLLQPGVVEELDEYPAHWMERPRSPGDDRFEPGWGFGGIHWRGQRIPIRAAVRLRTYYDDNVFIADTGARGDLVMDLIPRFYVETAPPDRVRRAYFTAGYDPRILQFADIRGISAWNHRGFARFRYRGRKVGAEIAHRSEEFSETSRDVGGRTEGARHLTVLTLQAPLAERTSLEVVASQWLKRFDGPAPADSQERWLEPVVVYDKSRKLQLAAGARLGWFDMDGAPDQTFQKLFTRIDFSPSPKLSFDVDLGLDVRQFENPLGARDRTTGEFLIRAEWEPRRSTTLALLAYRNVKTSDAPRNIVTSGVGLSLRQRLQRKLVYSCSVAFESDDFRATRGGDRITRDDDYIVLRNALDYRFNDWASLGFFHRFETNDSNAGASFDRHQLGFDLQMEF